MTTTLTMPPAEPDEIELRSPSARGRAVRRFRRHAGGERGAGSTARRWKMRDSQLPILKGELLVRVAACGVCHTDLHIVEGELHPPSYPVVPGHQVVGTVEAIGDR